VTTTGGGRFSHISQDEEDIMPWRRGGRGRDRKRGGESQRAEQHHRAACLLFL
jgi:hypothetical protein